MVKSVFDLDMTPGRMLPLIINVSQYDDIGRTIVFNLYSSVGAWTAPTSASVTFEGGKPDGKFFAYNCAYSSGTVTVTIQQQMTAVAGKVRCKIKVTSGSKVVESAPIIMVVDAAAVPDGSDMSKSDINDAIANATQKIVDQVKDNIPSDYAQLSTDVSSLKEDLGDLSNETLGVLKSYNLLDPAKVAEGNVNHRNGTVNTDSGYYRSDYIEVEQNTKYTYNGINKTDRFRICFYDGNKKFISGYEKTGIYENNIDFDTVENTKYIRFSIHDNMGKESSCVALSGLPYIPYDYSITYSSDKIREHEEYIAKYTVYNLISGYKSGKWVELSNRGKNYDLALSDNSNYNTSYLIPVKQGDKISFWYNNLQSFAPRRISEYTKDMILIGVKDNIQSYEATNEYVSYISISCEKAYTNKFAAVIGESAPKKFKPNAFKELYDSNGKVLSDGYLFGWRGKTICTYGDSITQYGFWQKRVIEYFDFEKSYMIGLSGTTVSDATKQKWWVKESTGEPYGSENDYSSKPYDDAILVDGYFCADSRINVIPEDTDVILVMGGTNDMASSVQIGELKFGVSYDISTFKGGLAETVKKVQTRLPKAQIVLLTPIYNATKDIMPYVNAVKEVADELGIEYINMHNCGINRFNSSEKLRDKTHPTYNVNASGAEMMANCCISGLQKIRPHYN